MCLSSRPKQVDPSLFEDRPEPLRSGNHGRRRYRMVLDPQSLRIRPAALIIGPHIRYAVNMQLSRVVETSGRVAATTKRLEKIGLIAALLEQLQPEEVEIAVSFLSGSARQGRIGIGYS